MDPVVLTDGREEKGEKVENNVLKECYGGANAGADASIVCFARYAMGDLEDAEVDDVRFDLEQEQNPCATVETLPNSQDDDIPGDIGERRPSSVGYDRSKLSISNVSWVSVNPGPSYANYDDDEENGVTYRGASSPSPSPSPPDNTPVLSLSKELLQDHEDRNSDFLRESTSVAGRVWNKLRGRSSKDSEHACALYDEAEEKRNRQAGRHECHSIEEIEATLEEIRLDGDDPSVEYLVEEADVDDVTSSVTSHSLNLEVEELHEYTDGALNSKSSASGFIARIFSRSRTNRHESYAQKRAKSGSGTKDRISHRVSQMKAKRGDKPQKQALTHALPRVFSRWLCRNQCALGAEGDGRQMELDSSTIIRDSLKPFRKWTQPNSLMRPGETPKPVELQEIDSGTADNTTMTKPLT